MGLNTNYGQKLHIHSHDCGYNSWMSIDDGTHEPAALTQGRRVLPYYGKMCNIRCQIRNVTYAFSTPTVMTYLNGTL